MRRNLKKCGRVGRNTYPKLYKLNSYGQVADPTVNEKTHFREAISADYRIEENSEVTQRELRERAAQGDGHANMMLVMCLTGSLYNMNGVGAEDSYDSDDDLLHDEDEDEYGEEVEDYLKGEGRGGRAIAQDTLNRKTFQTFAVSGQEH